MKYASTLNLCPNSQPWGWLIDLMTDSKSLSTGQPLSPLSFRPIRSFPVV